MKTPTRPRIVSYTVRRPGNTCWSEGHRSERAARRAALNAEQVTGLTHHIYAERADGVSVLLVEAPER